MSDVIRVANIENYTIEFINGDLIFTPKKSNITEEELTKELVSTSRINEFAINTQKGEELYQIFKKIIGVMVGHAATNYQ